VKATEDRSDIH